MAGEWLPMRMDLHEDPAVILMSAKLGIDTYGVMGRLHRLWSWANQQLADGRVDNLSPEWCDAMLSTPGFASAMSSVGWLVLHADGGLSFPNFDRWNSQGAKRRLEKTRQKRTQRVVAKMSPKCRQNVAKMSPDLATRGEERREEIREEKTEEHEPAKTPAANTTPPAKPTAIATAPTATEFPGSLAGNLEFAAAWAEWVADRKARRNALTAQAVKLQLGKLEPLGPIQAAECIRQSIEKGWTGLFPERFRGRGGGGGGGFKTRAEAESEYAANILINAIGGPKDGIEF